MNITYRATCLGLFGALAFGPLALAANVENKRVTNADASIGYSVTGTGPLVVILASTGRGTAEFADLADRLAQRGYRVALPEPRGVAPSHGPMKDVTFHDFANDFAAVIRAEGGPAIVAGHAYGQWIARTMAADHPDLVKGVVMVAGGARKWPAELSAAITTINSPAATQAQKLAGLRLAFFAEGNDPRHWLQGWYPAVTQSQREARTLTRQESWWAAGRAPILDLQGGADPFRPESSRMEVREEFGDRVTVKLIPNASHALPAEKPVETADAIADWADGLFRR
jgi:pimeloyl-ACP methyl ester carboxylesterase